jgi:acetate kinase
MLNKQSGLLGLSGLTANMRELLEEEAENGDRRARLAIDVFCYRVKKYLGAYLAAMNGADAVVFAGGIGENAPPIRQRICAGLDWLGIALDPAKNAAPPDGESRIDRDGSRVQVWVIPTDEELLIARDTWRVVTGADVPY